MKHKGTCRIESHRLILRQFIREDIHLAYRNWMSDEKVCEFLRWKAHESIEVTDKVINEWISNYKNTNFYQWAIVFKEINQPIGCISVVDSKENLDILHIGYCIGSKWWNRGITSEAFSIIIPFLFEEVAANRIESQHDPLNPNSGKVMQKCGLRYEGTMRQADYSNRGIVDAAVYSILKAEWLERNKM